MRYLALKIALRLHDRGYGYKKIRRVILENYHYAVSAGVIGNWLNGRFNPLGRHRFPLVSRQLVYAIAAAVGDGMSKFDKERGGLVVFQHLKDEDFAQIVAKSLGTRHSLNVAYGYDVVGRGTIISDLVLVGKRDPWAIHPILKKYPDQALKGFFDAEGGVDVFHGKVTACNTNEEVIEVFSCLLRKLSIHHSVTHTKMNPFFVDTRNRRIYLRKKQIRHQLNVFCCCTSRYAALVGFAIDRKMNSLQSVVRVRQQKGLPSCPATTDVIA